MTKLEELYDEIENDGVDIVNANFSGSKKVACMHGETFKAIILDKPKITTSVEERCALAEGLEYHKTGATEFITAYYNHPQEISVRTSYEAKVKRQFIQKYLPFDNLKEAMRHHCSNGYELAEYFAVTIEWIEAAFELYERWGYSFYDDDEDD